MELVKSSLTKINNYLSEEKLNFDNKIEEIK